jgi:hypothetical protein
METAADSTQKEAGSAKNSQACSFSWQNAQERWNESWKRLDACIQEKPRQYFLGALAVGYVFQLIPWRALFVLLGVLCLRLLRPILVVVAVIKLAEFIERKSTGDATPPL